MKLKHLFPQRYRSQVVRQFGDPQLIRQPNGQHELLGGTDTDRAAAFEWTSLFAHEIVFSHFYREGQTRCHPRRLRGSPLPVFGIHLHVWLGREFETKEEHVGARRFGNDVGHTPIATGRQ